MKKEHEVIIKIDSRNRFTIPKEVAGQLSSNLFRIYREDGNIILEPIIEVPKEEQWLFDPKNKEIVAKLKKALKQKATKKIDLSSFEEE